MKDKSIDNAIFRVCEYNNGNIYEIAFIKSIESTRFYLESCNSHNTKSENFYFAHRVKIEN